MNIEQCHLEMTQLLQAHNARVGDAIDYLEQVRQAIADNQIDQLQDSLAEPSLALSEFEQLEQQRFQLLAKYGYSPDQGGFIKCLNWCDDEQGQVDDLYQELVENLVKLQHSIQLNSLLVTKGQERVRRSLSILTGQGKAGGCKTYSSKGKAVDAVGQRDIAVA